MPTPAELERRFRVLAVLEAMLTARYPRYTYSRDFSSDPSYRIGLFDNGGGDEFIRLAFSYETPARCYEGARLIAQAIRQARR